MLYFLSRTCLVVVICVCGPAIRTNLDPNDHCHVLGSFCTDFSPSESLSPPFPLVGSISIKGSESNCPQQFAKKLYVFNKFIAYIMHGSHDALCACVYLRAYMGDACASLRVAAACVYARFLHVMFWHVCFCVYLHVCMGEARLQVYVSVHMSSACV